MKIEQKVAILVVALIALYIAWRIGQRSQGDAVWLCGTINGQQIAPMDLSGSGLLIRACLCLDDKPNLDLHVCSPDERRAGISRKERP